MVNWFKSLWADPQPKAEEVRSTKNNVVLTEAAPRTAWRNNMWVMTPEGVGIIFQLAEPVIVHLVDTKTGETIRSGRYDSSTIRQAKFNEIPEVRRCDAEKARRLGYL